MQTLDGSVHSQGVKLKFRDWLDMGSEGWQKTSEAEKAAAYQAAGVCGWQDAGLKAVILKELAPRIDEFMADLTIDTLKDYAVKHPVAVEQVYEPKIEVTFKN